MKNLYPIPVLVCCLLWAAASIAQNCPITVDAGPDKYLCAPPTPTQLDGDINGTYLNFFWTPTTGMTGANTLTPTVSVTTTTSYVLTARAVNLSNNLIMNGDFEQGNVGFYSDYVFSPGNLVPEGTYDVINNPQADHPNFQPCVDHTSGNGNMMVVNGAGVPNQNVWCQTITGLIPNAQYVFSCWVSTVVASSPARLQFEINGATIGPIFNAPASTCVWQNFYAIWTNGAATTATICILNQNTTLGGNDFALDDLLFAPICEEKDTVKVHVINVTAKASPAIVTIPCNGANFTLSGAGSSTGANITYKWTTNDGNIVSGDTTLSPVINAAGTYTLTVTYEENGFTCTKTASVSVIESPNPYVAWINPPTPLGCGSPTLTLLGNSSQPGITAWKWEASAGGHIVSGEMSKNAIIDKPGTYTLTATNTVTGCTGTAEVQVTTATNPPTAIAIAPDTLTCVRDTVRLLGTGSTTGTAITYLWSTSNGKISGPANTINTTATAAGTYILAVTNTQNGCIAYDTVTVIARLAPPTLSIAPPGILDCDTDTLSLSASVSPNTVTLHWTTIGGNIASGDSTLTPRITQAGIYILRAVRTDNACADTDTVTVSSNYTAPLAVVQPPDSITCQHSSVTLSGNGSSTGPQYRYHWTAGPGGNIVSGENTLQPTVNAPATYTLLVTDTINACTASASVQVVADQNIVLAVANAPDTLTCIVSTVDLNSTGSTTLPTITYLWSTTNGLLTGPVTNPTATAARPGTYQLLITNTANGCTATDLAVVAIDTAAPKIHISPTNILTCAHPERTIQATNLSTPGVYEYLWTPDTTGNIVAGAQTLTPTVNLPGVYTLLVKNLETGCTAVYTTPIGIANNVPLVTATVPGPLTCASPVHTLTANITPPGGTILYAWSVLGSGNIIGASDIPNPSVDQPGTYGLLITNTTNGCTATTSIVVLENKTAPPAEAGLNATLSCKTPTTLLTANAGQTGSYTYQWSSPDGHFLNDPAQPEVSVDSAGLYRLLVTDPANGCTATDSVRIFSDQVIPNLTLTLPDTLTCLVKEVNFSVSISPAGFHTTQWSTLDGHFTSGQNTPTPRADQPGFYQLLVTNDVNGCTQTASLSVRQDTLPPAIQLPATGPITCAFPTRSVTAQVAPPTGNFDYAWTSAAGGNITSPTDGPSITVSTGGTYTLLVTRHPNGCTAQQALSIGQDTQLPSAEAGPSDTLSCKLNSLTLSGTASAEPGLSYLWTASGGGHIQNGATTLQPTVDQPGLYTLLVSNPQNGCTATDSVQIFNDLKKPLAHAGKADTLTCVRTTINLSGSGSTGPQFSYLWTASGGGHLLGDPTTLTPDADQPGIYTLAITDISNGCVTTSSVTIMRNVTPPSVNAGPDATLTCTLISLQLSGSSAGGPATYAWAATNGGNIVSGNNTPTPTINRSGTYTLTATLLTNGCTASDVAQVGIDTLRPDFSIEPPLLLTCVQKTSALVATVQQPAAGQYTAVWTTQNGHFTPGPQPTAVLANLPGLYVLTLTNSLNGCSRLHEVEVLQDIKPPIAQVAKPDTITCIQTTVTLDGTGSSTGPDFSYQWTTFSGGKIEGGTTAIQAVASWAGEYQLKVTAAHNGCTATATVYVPVNAIVPTAFVPTPPPLTCSRDSAVLNASNSSQGPQFTYVWSAAAGGHFLSLQNPLLPVVDQPGTYILRITDTSSGCTDETDVSVTQDIQAPGADAGPPLELHCNLPESELTGSSPTQAVQYFWTVPQGSTGNILAGALTAHPSVDEPGVYRLQVTDPQNGCTATDETTVTAVPSPAFMPTVKQPDCLDPTGAVQFGPITGGKAPFRYSVNGGQSYSSSPNFNSLKIGTYSLRVQDAYGCEADETVNLQLPFEPTVSLPPLYQIQLGDSVLLVPELNQPGTNIVSWQWIPAVGLDLDSIENPSAKPLVRTIYTLKIKDKNGCTATARTEIQVNRRRQLYAPNVFSPNGDGHNDRFMLFGKGTVEVRELAIYDRWGNQLYFEEHLPLNDQTIGWDGTFRGQPMNPAVFVWRAVVVFIDGEAESYFGDVTIER